MAMKLWLLRPKGYSASERSAAASPANYKGTPWESLYDCTFGLIIRAASEREARDIAVLGVSGDEGKETWRDPKWVTCCELTGEGEAEVIMRDFHAG